MAYEDLLKDTSTPIDNNNYFLVTIPDLNENLLYPIQLRWKYNDGLYSAWSVVKTLQVPVAPAPGTPSNPIVDFTQPGMIKVTWNGNSGTGSPLTGIDRVDIYINGAPFDGTKPTDSFFSPGTKTITAPAGTYIVALYAVDKLKKLSPVSGNVTGTVVAVGEVIQPPTNPNGFSIDRVLSGIQVNWAGTYANGTFTGFEAIKIYVGNSATATSGTYIDAGVMTGNNVKNSITLPVDGTYLRYNLPVYIHAAAVNKNGTIGTLQQNVANNSLGARSAISTDLADAIISNAKLVDDAVSAVKIATGAITETKIATDAITSPKIAAGAIVAGKIAADAVTANTIAANAITAGKILAGEIDVTKLAAGTISVNNLAAGTITSTSYIRAGTKSTDGLTGARVEISSATITQTGTNVLPGLYIYNSAGTAVLSAPLGGGLSIIGGGTFTGNLSVGSSNAIFKAEPATGIWLGNATYASAPFSVSVNGVLKADSGTIGGWTLTSTFLTNATNTVRIQPTANIDAQFPRPGIILGNTALPYLEVTSEGIVHRLANGNASGKFSLTTSSSSLSMSGDLILGTDYINANKTFSLGNGALTWDNTSLIINVVGGGPGSTAGNGGISLAGVTVNNDGTFGDSTLVKASNGYLTIGRAFYYNSTRVPAADTSRPDQGLAAFNVGDIWMAPV